MALKQASGDLVTLPFPVRVGAMIMKSLVKSAAALLLGGAMVASTANAAEFEMRQASDLDDLLKLVKERALFESAVNKDREREFIQKKAQQQSMLNSAKAERTAQEQRSDRLRPSSKRTSVASVSSRSSWIRG